MTMAAKAIREITVNRGNTVHANNKTNSICLNDDNDNYISVTNAGININNYVSLIVAVALSPVDFYANFVYT